MTNFLANSLNQYETYTYNLRLFMISPEDFGNLDTVIDTQRSILIADNARVAKYNISSAEQTFNVGHNSVREAFLARMTMQIQEPNGVTLLSTIKSASLQLGIPNHIHAGYLLVVEFLGRKPDGVPRRHPQVFYYPLTITDFTFKVNEGGTQYDVAFIDNGSAAFTNVNNVVREQCTIVAQTVGEFVEKFEQLLNESITDAWAANPQAGEFPDQYRFEFDETTENWRNWRFQVLDTPFEVSGTEFVGLPGEDPSLQVIVNNGSNITTIFGQVLQLTAEYKRILLQQNSFGEQFARAEPSSDVDTTLDSFPVFYKTVSNVEYGRFDRIAGQFSKTIVYKIKTYSVTNRVLDSFSYQRGITNSAVQNNRMNNFFSNNLLRKRYDYQYTGANTEILELDMDFNMTYYEITPHGGGYFGDPRVTIPRYLQDNPEVAGRLAEIGQARQQVATAQQNLNRVRNDARSSPIEIRIASDSSTQARDNFTNVVSQNTLYLNEEFGLSPNDIAFQLRWVGDVISGQDMNSSDNDERSGTLKFGGVKANLENSADFLKIELGIRGDPYWMGVPNSFQNLSRAEDELADFESGTLNFFLNVNFPATGEDASGRRKPSPDYQLSGVYLVVSVINQFRNGQFIQYLSAVRDMATNPSTVWDRLAGDDSVQPALRSAQIRQRDIDTAQAQEDAGRRVGQQ